MFIFVLLTISTSLRASGGRQTPSEIVRNLAALGPCGPARSGGVSAPSCWSSAPTPPDSWSIICMQVSIRSVSLEMAANRVGRRYNNKIHSPNRGTSREAGLSVQKRQARVTVKYNRKELQRRLDVEKWIDCGLDELYLGRVSPLVIKNNITGVQ